MQLFLTQKMSNFLTKYQDFLLHFLKIIIYYNTYVLYSICNSYDVGIISAQSPDHNLQKKYLKCFFYLLILFFIIFFKFFKLETNSPYFLIALALIFTYSFLSLFLFFFNNSISSFCFLLSSVRLIIVSF